MTDTGLVQYLENLENLENWVASAKVRENLEKSEVFLIIGESGKNQGNLLFHLVGNFPKLPCPQRTLSDTNETL